MSLFLPIKNVGGSMAVAVCQRCQAKMYAGERVKDPNNGLMVHKECCDIYDPWRLPARKPEDITVQRPLPDEPLEA